VTVVKGYKLGILGAVAVGLVITLFVPEYRPPAGPHLSKPRERSSTGWSRTR
jgi:hypothetical protein